MCHWKIKILLLLIAIATSAELLDGVPIHFKLNGNVDYTPSSGGIPIPGYKLQVVYTKNQWIGVRFMELTSSGNTDVLIFSRTQNQTSGNYECSVAEHYSTSVRQSVLLTDSVNRMDKKVTSFSTNNDFGLQLFRTKGITNGQDWQGSQFLRVCFFSSNKTFDVGTWTAQYQSCYGYDINDYVSTFKGSYLGNMSIENVDTMLYGGLQGSILQLMVFAYRPSVEISGTNLIIRLGDEVSSTVGFDYYKCQDGDYHGSSYSNMTKDLEVSGFDDGSCQILKSSSSIKINFVRYANTADQFDFNLATSSVRICFNLTVEECTTVNVPYLFPLMTVESAIKLFGGQRDLLGIIAILVILVGSS